MVANEGWRALFLEAKVHHVSTTTLNHYLLALLVEKRVPPKPTNRRFFFEEMWTRDEKCKEIIEKAWDLLRESPDIQFEDRIKSCQTHLQRWNHEVFDNVNKALNQKQDRIK